MKFDLCAIGIRKRDRLPHWDIAHGVDYYFDRMARDDRHSDRIDSHVVNNPSRTGLLPWRFVKSYAERIASIV